MSVTPRPQDRLLGRVLGIVAVEEPPRFPQRDNAEATPVPSRLIRGKGMLIDETI